MVHVTWEGWVTLGLILVMLFLLVLETAPPYMVMMGTLIIFIPLGILDVEQAFHGFSDEAVLSIAVLFMLAKGIEQSGGLEYVSRLLFSTRSPEESKGRAYRPSDESIVWVILKFSIPVALFSAFLANIPLVAMMIPPIVEFSRKVNTAPSKMLLPLSYAALLGGTLTLIGASTNLMVLSMAARKLPDLKMNMFEIGIVGVPATVAGILYLLAFSEKLLPDRLAIQATNINAREYNVVLVIKPASSAARKSIEQAGLRRQPGLQLLHVQRDGFLITDPGADFVLLPKDRLHFCGVIDSLLSLTQLDGLALSEDEGQEQVDLNTLKSSQRLVEAVVASKSPMVHKRVADLQFRARYRAAVVAVHRYGTRMNSAIGDIELEAGDSLLMVADGPEFVSKHRNNSTFALVSKRSKAGVAALLVLAMVAASGAGVKLITAALFAVAGLLLTRSMTPADALALVDSGAADLIAQVLMGLAGRSKFGLLTCTYIATTVFSLAITNNAAVTIMFPVALAAAQHNGLDFRPFAYVLMMAASAGFMTPPGCATNIMVYGPGGYKFADYLKFGGPMQIWILFVTMGVTVTLHYWWIWWLCLIGLTVALTPLLARQSCNLPKRDRTLGNDHAPGEIGAFSAADHDPSIENLPPLTQLPPTAPATISASSADAAGSNGGMYSDGNDKGRVIAMKLRNYANDEVSEVVVTLPAALDQGGMMRRSSSSTGSAGGFDRKKKLLMEDLDLKDFA
eukprot:jgi/Mesen1/508/ME000104S10599